MSAADSEGMQVRVNRAAMIIVLLANASLLQGCIYLPGGEVQLVEGEKALINSMAMSFSGDFAGAQGMREWFSTKCKITNDQELRQCGRDLGMTCTDAPAPPRCDYRNVIRSRRIDYFLTMPVEKSAGAWTRITTDITVRRDTAGALAVDFHRVNEPAGPVG